jgi:hypothetical protein
LELARGGGPLDRERAARLLNPCAQFLGAIARERLLLDV